MEPFRNQVLAGNQFDGLTSTTGLYMPANTGDARSQVCVNSLTFHTTGSVTTWTLYVVDPEDSSNATIILTDTSDDMYISGMLLAKEEDRESWGLKLITTGMTADGWLTIDVDAKATEQ